MRLINVLNDRAIENRIEQVQAQLEVMHLVPWDLSHQLIILDVEGIDLKLKTLQKNDKDSIGNGMEDNTKYTILQEKRIFLTGQCVLFGHTRIGHRLARSFGLNQKACTASSIYRILKEPTCWTLAQTMVRRTASSHGGNGGYGGYDEYGRNGPGTSGDISKIFDLVHSMRTSLNVLSKSSQHWEVIATQVIRNVGKDRWWWEKECRTHPPSLSSELLHLFGVSLGTSDSSMWPVTKLLAFTGQFYKCVDYVMSVNKSGGVVRPLLTFVLKQATICENEKAVKKCQDALSLIN